MSRYSAAHISESLAANSLSFLGPVYVGLILGLFATSSRTTIPLFMVKNFGDLSAVQTVG